MSPIYTSCLFLVYVYTMLLFCFIPFSFVHLLGHIWDPEFVCPNIDPVTTPSEEDQEYLDGLAEQ